MGKIVKMLFEGQNLQLIGKWTEVLCFQKEILTPGVALTWPWGYIHAYYHSSQTSLVVYISGFR